MPRTYNEIDARVTRLMKELENLKKELAGKQGTLEEGDGIVLTPDAQTNKTTISVDENVVALKEDFEANPTLAGTEPTLEGLKLLGTDYKVGGGGNLYYHHLTLTYQASANKKIYLIVPSTLNKKVTVADYRDILINDYPYPAVYVNSNSGETEIKPCIIYRLGQGSSFATIYVNFGTGNQQISISDILDQVDTL